jgi:hypothetical protein
LLGEEVRASGRAGLLYDTAAEEVGDADAIQGMSENPYRLARDIRGIGFKTADAIAMKLGIEKTAMVRVRAGISYALTEAMDDGHCGLPTDELLSLAERLLEVPVELVRAALDLELAEVRSSLTRWGAACVFGRLARADIQVRSAVGAVRGYSLAPVDDKACREPPSIKLRDNRRRDPSGAGLRC